MKTARIASLILFALLYVGCNDTTPSAPSPAPTPLPPTKQSALPTDHTSSPLPTDRGGDGEVLYQGPTTWGNEFQVRYDGDVWDYTEIGNYREPFLYHRGIAGCRLNLSEGARQSLEPDESETVSLAGHEWSRESYVTTTGGRYVKYNVEVDDSRFLFAVIYQDPLPEDKADQCLEDGETVLDTLQPR